MTLWWIGNVVLLAVIVPVVVILLAGVLGAARRARGSVDGLVPVAERISSDLDAAEQLHTTRSQVGQTVTVVANYGGSLDTILEDA